MSVFSTRRRVLGILAPLYVAVALAMSCSDLLWDITHGTDRLHARRGDFTAGTTRHAHSWDEVNDALCDCFGIPREPVDSVLSSITIEDETYASWFDRTTAALHMSRHDWNLGAQLGHELYHAHSKRNGALRHPLDSLNQGGEFDHAMMIRRPDCVHWCPPNQAGCRGILPGRTGS